jgi:hypothetical protein
MEGSKTLARKKTAKPERVKEPPKPARDIEAAGIMVSAAKSIHNATESQLTLAQQIASLQKQRTEDGKQIMELTKQMAQLTEAVAEMATPKPWRIKRINNPRGGHEYEIYPTEEEMH